MTIDFRTVSTRGDMIDLTIVFQIRLLSHPVLESIYPSMFYDTYIKMYFLEVISKSLVLPMCRLSGGCPPKEQSSRDKSRFSSWDDRKSARQNRRSALYLETLFIYTRELLSKKPALLSRNFWRSHCIAVTLPLFPYLHNARFCMQPTWRHCPIFVSSHATFPVTTIVTIDSFRFFCTRV